MTRSILSAIILLIVTSCTNKGTNNDPDPEDALFLTLDTPENVIANFQRILKYDSLNIPLDSAITEYQDLFMHDDATGNYSFIFGNTNGGVVYMDTLDYQDEARIGSNLLIAVNDTVLTLDPKTFFLIDDTTQIKTDSTGNYPYEVWPYRYSIYMIWMTGYYTKPRLIDGDVVFYIAKCSDDSYRIIKWYDLTYEAVYPKATAARPLERSNWGELKLLFNN